MKEISDEVKKKHDKNIWTILVCTFLSMWLIFSHFALGYVTVAMVWSDIITGLVVYVASMFALRANRFGFFCLWVICFAGLWLNFAPLIFWAKGSVEYLNDTVIGILLVIFSLIIPGLPGKVEDKGHGIPAGWSYNPSAWLQRIPVIKLGIVGMFISRYLTAYQLGYIDTAWDPVFGGGTIEVITSNVAGYFPVPDAGLGCFAYTIEVLLGLKGGENRWRTMPWMVVGFVLLVVPLGIVSIILVILQPLVVGAWCFLCLCTATAMMFMIVYAVDELIAVFQFLHQSKKAGKSLWKTFWHGGDLPGSRDDDPLKMSDFQVIKLEKRANQGIGWRWNLALSAVLGILLMLSPYIFSTEGVIEDIDHFIGSLVVVVSILSFAEVIRSLRFMNMLFGVCILVLSWIYSDMGLAFYHSGIGIALVLLAIPRGPIKETYGPWQKMIK